jgi:hypothetical protein
MFANDIINKVQDIVNASNIPAEQDAIKDGIPKEIMAVINNNSYDNDDDDDDGGEEIPCDSQASESQAGDDA